MVEKEIKNIKPQNHTKKDRVWQGIKKREKLKDIVVRPADGGLVILTKKGYLDQLNRLVRDTTTYQPLKKNPNREFF